ncbi:MAG: class I SAM-dependent methyltransferase [Candidatus Dormibacteria bacterium]
MTELSRGDAYDATYELRAAAGEEVHGEANFVFAMSPRSVLDAGCGTGRVGRELFRRGLHVVGVDLDPEMLATARSRCPEVTWIAADLSEVSVGQTFDVIVMAGNVINFVAPDRRRMVVENLSRHLNHGGALVSGHSVRPGGCDPADFVTWARSSGLHLVEQWSTWERDAWDPSSPYALAVFRN